MTQRKPTIEELYANGTIFDHALTLAVQDALRQHRQAGNPIAEWCDGKVVWIPPEEIPAERASLPAATPSESV
jgi:hypothetical protein